MKDSELRIYQKYEHLGYDVIQYGVPDLILLKNGKIEFVEVKTDSSYGLNENQIRAFKLLEKHGIKVRVEVVKRFKYSNIKPPRGRHSLYYFPLTHMPWHKRPCFPPWLFEQT